MLWQPCLNSLSLQQLPPPQSQTQTWSKEGLLSPSQLTSCTNTSLQLHSNIQELTTIIQGADMAIMAFQSPQCTFLQHSHKIYTRIPTFVRYILYCICKRLNDVIYNPVLHHPPLTFPQRYSHYTSFPCTRHYMHTCNGEPMFLLLPGK